MVQLLSIWMFFRLPIMPSWYPKNLINSKKKFYVNIKQKSRSKIVAQKVLVKVNFLGVVELGTYATDFVHYISSTTVLVLVDSQDGVRHPDKGTDKTILLISRHYWRPAQENGRMEGRTGALPLPPRRLIAHHDQQQQQLLCKRSLASCCSKKDPLFIYEHH